MVRRSTSLLPSLTRLVACFLLSVAGAVAATSTQSSTHVGAETLTIRIPKNEASNSGHTSYVVELLRLALEHSKQPNETILLQPVTEDYTQARLIAELHEAANIDVIWTMTSKEREQTLTPIRVPILKGLLGQRVFLIRESQQYIFEQVLTLDNLARLIAGQGSHWPDTDILRANGLTVFTSPHYELLFNMLKGGRFHYFPRGVNEAWAEIEAHPNEGLAVEKYLLLSYPAPMYFFVHPNNLDLANRIERGLEAMINDGSFDTLFLTHPSIIDVVKRAKLENRRVFKLLNPDLPKETPLGDPRYWLQLH